MTDETPRRLADPDLERARVWWKDYGRPIVGGAAIALISVVGYNYWQNLQQTRGEHASALFEQLREQVDAATAARDAAGESDDETGDDETAADDGETTGETTDDAATLTAAAADTADELMRDYASTPYAAHAAFALAKVAVDDGDLPRATSALQWALDNAEGELRHIARLRLATLLLAQDQAAAAAGILQVEDTAGFTARYRELNGDAAFQQGDAARAREFWQESMRLLRAGSAAHELLKLKLDNLGQ